jgi:expansin (peptidoglycan-binding protein)
VGACKFPTAHNGNGSLTWYTLSQGTDLVNCSFPTHKSSETVDYVLNSGQYFAAMNTQEYATAAACGACVEVTRDNNKKVTVMVADQCPVGSNPKCKAGHIDLAKPAFSQLASGSEGYLGTGNGGDVGTISWKYVPCPITGNVKVHLKDPSNQNWNEFMVANHRIPIAKFEAEVNGTWTAGTRKEYNFFNVNGGNVTFPLNVRITDLNGSVITFAVAAGTAVQDTGAQFPSCQ